MEQDSPLLKLPAELRNHVYRYALVPDEGLDVTQHNTPREPGLLATCRQIRAEALPIFYAETHFYVQERVHAIDARLGTWASTGTQFAWVESIGVTRCALIQTFSVQHSELGGDTITKQHGDEVLCKIETQLKKDFTRFLPIREARRDVTMLLGAGLSPKAVRSVTCNVPKRERELAQVVYCRAAEHALRARVTEAADELDH